MTWITSWVIVFIPMTTMWPLQVIAHESSQRAVYPVLHHMPWMWVLLVDTAPGGA